MKQFLTAAAARVSKRFTIYHRLYAASYVFGDKSIKFHGGRQMLKGGSVLEIDDPAGGKRSVYRGPSALNFPVKNPPFEELRRQPRVPMLWRSQINTKQRTVLALDRVLSFPDIRLEPAEAEKKFGTGVGAIGFRARVTLEFERAVGNYLLMKVVGVEVLDSKLEKILWTFGPETFLTPEQALAKQADTQASSQRAANAAQQVKIAAQQRKADEAAAIAAEKAKIKVERQAKQDACDGRSTTQERIACYQPLCASLDSTLGFDNGESRLCRVRVASLRRGLESEQRTIKSNCRTRLYPRDNTRWMPLEGDPEYQAGMAVCLRDPVRGVYGPDIIGLRLGQEGTKATSIMLHRLETKYGSTFKETRPFEGGFLSWSDDASRGIAHFDIMNHGKRLVAAISRRLYFDADGPSRADIVAGLRKKYGREAWSSKQSAMLWTFGADKSQANKCAGLVDLIQPRGKWSHEWRPRLSSAERQQQRQQTAQSAQDRGKTFKICLKKVETNLLALYSNGNQPSAQQQAALNDELTKCQQDFESGATTQTTVAETARLPMMVGTGGSPQDYAEYSSCGPVVISLFNQGADGGLKDASFVLFDPAWIASQPAFAFKGGMGTGPAAKAGKKKIDF